jgi:hypothetical protein
VAYHGQRGERVLYVRELEVVDRLAAAAGSTWRNDVTMLRNLWATYTLCEDVMSLKRAMQQLQTLADEKPAVARLRNLVEACYLSERGQPHEALERFDAAFQSALQTPGLRSCQELGAYARILRKAGLPARARDICEQTLAALVPEERAFVLLIFGVQSERVLALAALGDCDSAARLADELLAEHAASDNPLLQALMHGVRAEVAVASTDWARFDREIAAMQEYVQLTQHPALFAQTQRIGERARLLRRALTLPAHHLQNACDLLTTPDDADSFSETQVVDPDER